MVHVATRMELGNRMKSILYVVGLIMLGKGGYDFYGAIFGTTTFEDVINTNIQFEATYYIFGIIFGVICKATKDDGLLKVFSGIVGLFCLLISGFVLLDSHSDTTGAAYDCVSSSNMDQCLK